MTRRDFLTKLGLATTAVALSPLLDLAEIIPGPSLLVDVDSMAVVAQIMVNLEVHNPRRLKVLTGICS